MAYILTKRLRENTKSSSQLHHEIKTMKGAVILAIEFRGEEILFVVEIEDGAGTKLARPFNQTGGSKEISADTIDLDTKDKTGSDYGKITETVSLEGILTQGDEFISFIKRALRTKKLVKIYEVNTRTKEAESGQYMISTFSREYSNGDFATYSLEGTLNGALTTSTMETIPDGAGEYIEPEPEPPKFKGTITRGKYYSTVSDGTKNDLTYQSKHYVQDSSDGLKLLYANVHTDDRTTDLSPITIKASLFDGTTNHPMTFAGGADSITLQPGDRAYTDVLELPFAEKTNVWVRTNVVTDAGGKHPRGLLLFSSPNNEGYTIGDTTRTAGKVTPVAGTLYGYAPLALLSVPRTPSTAKVLGIVGSSSSTGTGRGNTVWQDQPQGDLGFLQIGASMAGWSSITAGMNGQKASDFANPAKRAIRMEQLKTCDLVIVQYASNDLSDNAMTFETLRTNLLAIHKAFWDIGIPTAQVTVNPRTNSTDSWATTENQTPINANFAPGPDSARSKYNAWVMNNSDGIRGIDCNPGWESSPGSALWGVNPPKTGDGIHPNTAGHDGAAATAIRDFLLSQS